MATTAIYIPERFVTRIWVKGDFYNKVEEKAEEETEDTQKRESLYDKKEKKVALAMNKKSEERAMTGPQVDQNYLSR